MKIHINLKNEINLGYVYNKNIQDCWVVNKGISFNSDYYLVCDGRNLNVKVYSSPTKRYVYSTDLYKRIKSIL